MSASGTHVISVTFVYFSGIPKISKILENSLIQLLNVSKFNKLDVRAIDSEMKFFLLKVAWGASYNVITDKSTCRPIEKMGWWSEGHETVKKRS